MRILDNGLVEIRNKKTGETRMLKPEDLPSYGISYTTYSKEAKAYKEITGKKVTKGEDDLSAEEKKQTKKTGDTQNIVTLLEDLYYKGGQTTGLAKNKTGVIGGKAPGKTATLLAKVKEDPQYETYKRTLESKRGLLAKAAGDTGNLALQEQILAGKGLPQGYEESPELAFELFSSLRNAFQLGDRPRLQQIEQNYQAQKTGQAQSAPMTPPGTMPPKKRVDKSLKGLVENASKNAFGLAEGINGLLGPSLSPGIAPLNQLQSTPQQMSGMAAAPGAIAGDIKSLMSSPTDYAYENPLDLLLMLAGGAGIGGAAKAGKLGKISSTTGPAKYVNTGSKIKGMVEQMTPKRGQVDSMVEKEFGTTQSPNLGLIQGLGSAADQTKLSQLLKNEISTQGRSAGAGIKGVSVEDLLNFRQGSYKKAYDSSLGPAEKELSKRIGTSYSKILHTLEPELKKLDKAYGRKEKIKGQAGKAKKGAAFVVGSAVAYKLLDKLGL